MANDPRVEQLLEELLESDRSPEDVCRSCPELLPMVLESLRKVRLVERLFEGFLATPGLDLPKTAHFGSTTDGEVPHVSGYAIESVLGRGGVGVVYKARQLSLSRLVALKMLLAGPYASPDERLRFQREAEAIAALHHANIVQVYDVGEHEGRLYFTMEFLEGGSLAQKIQGAPQTAREAAGLVSTLARAVQAAHQAGIVHRDLKPGNVLLTTDGTPKLSDFGLAKRQESGDGLTLSGALGTPSYMAPEQAQGRTGAADPAVDVHALGAMLYELLTGRPPFRAATHAETLRQVIFDDPVPPSRLNSSVPRDVETICLKCLQKTPALRYAGADAMANDLDNFLRGEAIAARPDGRLHRVLRRIRRQPVLATVVASSTLLVLVLVGGASWLISQRAAGERAAEKDLGDMARLEEASLWPEAQAALDRANVRIANGASAPLRARVDQGLRELQLVQRLDRIRLDRLDRKVQLKDHADEAYETAFVDAGIGRVGDDASDIAARIRALPIRNALVAALDDWSLCFHLSGQADPTLVRRAGWVVEVAQRSDSDPAGWHGRARDPKNWNAKSLHELTRSVPIEDSSVSLLIALANRLQEAEGDPIPFLTKLQAAHSDDFWANFVLANKLREAGAAPESVRYFQAALTIRPHTSDVQNNLGLALMTQGLKEEPAETKRRWEEAIQHLQKAVDLDPSNTAAYGNVGVLWSLLGQHDKAIERLTHAVGRSPDFAVFHVQLANCLEIKHRPEEAIAHYRRGLALARSQTPQMRVLRRETRNHLIAILTSKGRFEEARSDWAKVLEAKPPDHDVWYGYAELCLFVGQEKEYRRNRRILLERFRESTEPQIAERTARACLLLPAAPDELSQSVALVERVLKKQWEDLPVYRHYLFLRGLAEYRQGQFDAAVSTMRGRAADANLGSAPRLVESMALNKQGQAADARKTLALATERYDWRPERALDQDAWICHVLRREAEGMIFPNLHAFLEGKYQPRDNDERIAFLGTCEFANRTRAAAGLYADVFAADPPLANDVGRSCRYKAARMAALAGCGRGTDAAGLGESERKHWREQARQWLRSDLTAWGQLLDNSAAFRDKARETLSAWRGDADLASLRETVALSTFDDHERKDCLALWAEAALMLKRAESIK
jgi:eukaryotic-like serine/threonine-protein kinase